MCKSRSSSRARRDLLFDALAFNQSLAGIVLAARGLLPSLLDHARGIRHLARDSRDSAPVRKPRRQHEARHPTRNVVGAFRLVARRAVAAAPDWIDDIRL